MASKIIYIDDSQSARKFCKLVLGKLGGFDVHTYESLEQALPCILESRPDLVLLDYWLGEQEGSEVLGEIRGVFGPEELPIVFFTASEDSERRQKLQAIGALDVILKSCTPAEIVGRVKELLVKKEQPSPHRESPRL